MAFKVGLPPIIGERSRILILGTLPGNESLRREQYYANSSNQLWKLLVAVYGEAIGEDYSQRVEFLHRRRLALWDVLRSAERAGSSDRRIKNPVANDFSDLLLRLRWPERRATTGSGRFDLRLQFQVWKFVRWETDAILPGQTVEHGSSGRSRLQRP
jgi:hypoxanthine-DNA glycosylase